MFELNALFPFDSFYLFFVYFNGIRKRLVYREYAISSWCEKFSSAVAIFSIKYSRVFVNVTPYRLLITSR